MAVTAMATATVMVIVVMAAGPRSGVASFVDPG